MGMILITRKVFKINGNLKNNPEKIMEKLIDRKTNDRYKMIVHAHKVL
jgi:hypothetical protein